MKPIFDALTDKNFIKQTQFHMPGHLRGRGFETFGADFKIDVTELPETDDLHCPEGVIRKSQEYAARVFGSKHAYYLVNGSTSGVLAMVLGCVGDGEKIIADRFCHKSFVSALALSGAEAVWVKPKIIDNGTMWGGIEPSAIEKAIRENPDAKAVYITAPNYFGMMSDVESIARLAHNNNMMLLVDGAHGAHFGMSDKLPPSIISLGADMVCMSLHKTLPSLTQTAILLTNEKYDRVESALRTVQSSSPSYVFMASCEHAVEYYEKCPKDRWDKVYEWVKSYFPEQLECDDESVKFKDFTRLNCPVYGNPFAAMEIMRKQHEIALECAYGGGVVAIVNSLHTEEEIKKLKNALSLVSCEGESVSIAPMNCQRAKSPREAFFAKKKRVPLSEAVGKISAEGIMVYPPGVYQVLPGEVIDESAVNTIFSLVKKGAEIPSLDELNCLIFDE